MAIVLNLEIVVDADLTILAFRYDLPDDMKWMVINAGRWQVVDENTLGLEYHIEVRSG